jgi:hypothetical protein
LHYSNDRYHISTYMLYNYIFTFRNIKMEKIVVLTGNHKDNNLIKCLEMLFPECMIEVLEKKKPETEKEKFSQPSRKMI